MKPLYSDISHITLDIMVTLMELEWEYLVTNDPDLLCQIQYYTWLFDYWEDIVFKMTGRYSFDFTLLL